jgi:hypothetical protein
VTSSVFYAKSIVEASKPCAGCKPSDDNEGNEWLLHASLPKTLQRQKLPVLTQTLVYVVITFKFYYKGWKNVSQKPDTISSHQLLCV